MKLRLRSLQSKETLKIEVPNSATLRQLKEILSQTLSSPSSSSSSSVATSLRFSLNRKDELQGSSPDDALQSLGITSGDLIYFSLGGPNDFSSTSVSSSQALAEEQVRAQRGSLREPIFDQSVSFPKSETFDSNMVKERDNLVQRSSVQGHAVVQADDVNICEPRSKELEISQELEVPCLNFPIPETTPDGNLAAEEAKTPISDSSLHEKGYEMSDAGIVGQESDVYLTKVGEGVETQEFYVVEGMDVDEGSIDVASFRFSEPCFLRRFLREELGNYGGDHKLLIIAIHAVFLESGFVGFDQVSGMRVDGFHLPEEWPSKTFTLSLWYTLPELLGKDNVAESVVLKFQKLGHFLNVYGSLTKNGSGLYRVCLNEYRFAPTIDLVWANCDKNDIVTEADGLSRSYPENEVFEFWKIVKDGLALPLLIDLCDRANFDLPACLMRLPTELKLKILESLPGIDIARIGCVCSEMRYLASNNDLWRQKFAEEFSGASGAQEMNNWKLMYASYWESRKKRKREMQMFPPVFRSSYFPFTPDPFPFGAPAPMIGGDYDRLPVLGVPSPFGQPRRASAPARFGTRLNFSPNCNLGRFHS